MNILIILPTQLFVKEYIDKVENIDKIILWEHPIILKNIITTKKINAS